MHRVVTVVGARPQFIKAATVSRALARYDASCSENRKIAHLIIHTGQHYDREMSQIFFDELEIAPPAYNLGIGSDNHGAQTGKMLVEVERILLAEHPDLVITYGDTNSTLAGILAASKLHITSAHVEAGLRSYNRRMPEEINRLVADELSNLLFCPSATAVKNLAAEGIPSNCAAASGALDFNSQRVYLVGDVMYDSILFYMALAKRQSQILDHIGLTEKGFCLGTIHRAENTDDPVKLGGILEGLGRIATSDVQVVLPLHPRTEKLVRQLPGWSGKPSSAETGVSFIDPVGYLDMVQLESNAKVVLTDSGGVQKEAFFLGVPCITLRDETEWVETVTTGWNTLVGASPERITEAVDRISKWDGEGAPFREHRVIEARALNVYGDGRASEKIVKLIAECLEMA